MNKTFIAIALAAMASTCIAAGGQGGPSGPSIIGMTPDGTPVKFEDIGKYDRDPSTGRYILKVQPDAKQPTVEIRPVAKNDPSIPASAPRR